MSEHVERRAPCDQLPPRVDEDRARPELVVWDREIARCEGALERLQLPAVGLHALRHSAAAALISSGASAKEVQSILGHRSAAFTLTVYGHLFDDDLDAVANRLEAHVSKLVRDQRGIARLPTADDHSLRAI